MYKFCIFLAFSIILTIGVTLCKGAPTNSQTVSDGTSSAQSTWLPTNFQASPAEEGMKLTWEKPKNSDATGYLLAYADLDEAPIITNIKSLDNKVHLFPKLKPWTNYVFGLRAYKISSTELEFGSTATAKQITYMQSPGAVGDLKITDVHSTTMALEWKEPVVKNGPISGYKISGYNKDEAMKITALNVTLKNLKPFQNYKISVLAYNHEPRNTTTPFFEGPPEYKQTLTCPSEPDVVLNLALKEKTNNSLTVEWAKPKTPNGPIAGYKVSCSSGNNSDIQENFYTFSDLDPGTPYQISVKAYNHDCKTATILEGKEVVVNLTTFASVPPMPKDIKLEKSTSTEIEFTAPRSLFSSEKGDIIENVLLVAAGDTMDLSGESKYEPLQDLQFKNWNESKNSKNMYRSSPQKWMLDSDNAICKIQKDEFLCTVGSQSDCEKELFCNGPLRKKTTYRIKIRGYTEAGWSETNAIEATTASGERAFAIFGLIAFSVTVTFAHL